MKIDANLGADLAGASAAAAELEKGGYAGVWVAEAGSDPFLASLQAITATGSVTVGTSVAIAFARNPMTLATVGNDLARASGGRFVLGLGSQVKAHIERRYSMPWSRPAARMRELVLAMRAIWASWQDGAKLDFQGDFYTHTLMTPFFAQQPHPHGPPPVYLAGVGELMTRVAGEVGDGFFVHPFTTGRYLREVTLPALRRGREKAGRDGLDGFTVAGSQMVVTGDTEEEIAKATRGIKRQIAFYASTPAYRPVLDLHGLGDLQPELTALSKQGRWREMTDMITDDVLGEFAVTGAPDEIAPALQARVGDVYDRVTLYTPYRVDPASFAKSLDGRGGVR
ncbi:TIGR03617 family F420-dependent LLM class oxidoreductase [Actinomadura sp. GC306]|uniref:TIGR03617 family F420-dependent LLM class oxidoreductase n=1 Tax=Actinomadura sp. GC306 TaxID=2530367 RepID=UPI00104523E0|nr:TIGR03617 family F420-dependent LLM class oxidoreductase [Actinomadura sp. GC306]TDC72026.1 TIGR03617 family F420-dependent LLM class oxidoreductase [Actinomadura sp. GC306]